MGITPADLLKRINKAPVGVLIFSGAFEINYISDSFKKIAGYYNFKYPTDNLNKDLLDIEILRDDLSYLSMGYSFEKTVKDIVTPGIGKISLVIKGIPFYEGENFAGGIITAEDFRLSAKDELTGETYQFKEVLKVSGDYLFITDKNGRIRFSSGRRYSSDKIYQSIFDIIPENKLAEFSESVSTSAAKRIPAEIITTTSLDLNTYECRIDPLLNDEGIPDYFLFAFNEISRTINENLKLRENLKSSEKFRAAVNTADQMIYIYDKNFHLHYSNRKSENLPNIAEHLDKAFISEMLKKHPVFSTEIEIHGKIFKVTFTTSEDEFINCFCTDITPEKQELNQLKESEELLRNIISGTDIIVLNLTPQGNILFSNRYFRENFNTPEMNFYEVIDKSFQTGFAIPDRKESDVEIPLTSHNKIVKFSFCFNPAMNMAGKVRYISATGININALSEEKNELRVFKDIFSYAGDGIAVIKNGRIHLANRSFIELFGFENEGELKGKRISDLSSMEERERIFDQIREIEISGFNSSRFEFSGRKKDDTEFFVSASLATFSSTQLAYTILVCRDITERRRVQQAIRESEEKFRNITENIDDFLYSFENSRGRLYPAFYTSSVEKITGYTNAEFLNDSRLVLKLVHPDDLPSVKKKLKTIFRSRLQVSDEFELRIINRSGNIVWVRNKINLIRNADGSIQKIYGLISDITLRKKAEDEFKRSSENLLKLNEAKDRFISIVSHDLRTPFSSILGFTDLLLNDDELTEEEKKQYAGYIQESSKSMLALVNSLLDWTRLQTGRIKFEPEKFDAESVVNEAVRVLQGSAIQKNIEIISSVKRDSIVFADKGLLLQAFNNLISNAIKFTRPGGQIIISSAPSEKLRFLQFSVKDNGVGIDEENLKNLFRIETKFTSEGTSGEKGSGLGLSLVKEIVEKHGGQISVQSKPGEGSEFNFIIPVTPSNILLVDDNSTDRLLYAKLLKNFAPDYNIETAANGNEAYEQILKSPPALIITDHIMPELNGYELVIKLNNSHIPDLPPVVILSSGLDRDTISAYMNAGIQFVFQKPVNLVEFKSTIEKLLRKGYLRG